MTQLTNIRGVVQGRTIQLEQELSVPDGEAVTITITTAAENSRNSGPSRACLDAAAGSLAGLDDEIDEFNRWYRESRHSDPANQRVIE
jgi:hypothetical protein